MLARRCIVYNKHRATIIAVVPHSLAVESSDEHRTKPNRCRHRLVSLDAYRGLTMLAMASGGLGLHRVAENFPDESPFWQVVGYQFEHVEWVGCAAWDLIQPSFMFMVGVAMAYSCASRAGPRADLWPDAARTPWCARSCWCCWAFFCAPTAAAQTNFTFEDVLIADRPGLHVFVPAVGPAALGAVRRGAGDPGRAIGTCSTSIRCPAAGFRLRDRRRRPRLAAPGRHRRPLGQEHQRRAPRSTSGS